MEDDPAPRCGAANPRARTITGMLMILLIGMIVWDIIVRVLLRRRHQLQADSDVTSASPCDSEA